MANETIWIIEWRLGPHVPWVPHGEGHRWFYSEEECEAALRRISTEGSEYRAVPYDRRTGD